ncbi:hypothetical protein GCM10010415_57160 [Streptomyces atrovirens]
MAVGFQLLSCWTIFEKHWNSAESPIIFFAVAWAEEALVVVAAWAGAAAIRVPQAAAARAAPARAFFGVATVRRREAADTGGLSVGNWEVAVCPVPYVRPSYGGACVGAATREGRRRLATAPRKQIPALPAKVPFTKRGRRRGRGAGVFAAAPAGGPATALLRM